MDFSSEKPPASALYLVDRDKQGKYYRYYNAETDTWGTCGADMNEALEGKDTPSNVGFYPWVGPLTGPKFNPNKEVVAVENDDKPKEPKKLFTKPIIEVDIPKQNSLFIFTNKRQCKYIAGDPQGTQTRVCGNRTINGTSWCFEHHALVYTKPPVLNMKGQLHHG